MKTYERYKPSGVEWIGDIPEHWNAKKLKYLVSLIDEKIPATDFLIAVENIESKTGKLVDLEGEKQYQGELNAFKEGDVLFNKLRPYLAKVYYAKEAGGCVGELLILRGGEEVDGKFLYYRTLSSDFIDIVDSSTNGTKMPRANWDGFINQLLIPYPSLPEQTAIAKYLDEKTAQLDKLIDGKRRLIALLKEERFGVINKAVTRGINPDAKLKPSGIVWLGEIPEDWTLTKIAYIARVVRGASPRPAGDTRFFNGDHTPWITVAEVTKDNDKYLTSVSEFLTEEGATHSRFVGAGILLLSNSGATLGVPKILKIGGCINDGSVAFLNLEDKVLIDYLYYFFKILTDVYREQMQGSGQPNLNTDIVKATPFCLPPIEEQNHIVQFIETETGKIDATVAKIEKEIEYLREYRTALISEVVTGKIKVV